MGTRGSAFECGVWDVGRTVCMELGCLGLRVWSLGIWRLGKQEFRFWSLRLLNVAVKILLQLEVLNGFTLGLTKPSLLG